MLAFLLTGMIALHNRNYISDTRLMSICFKLILDLANKLVHLHIKIHYYYKFQVPTCCVLPRNTFPIRP